MIQPGMDRLDNEYQAFKASKEFWMEDPKTKARLEVTSSIPLRKHIDPVKLQSRLDRFNEARFEDFQKDYVGTLLGTEYANYLDNLNLAKVKVLAKKDDIKVVVEGPACELPLWEVPISIQIHDLYNGSVLQEFNEGVFDFDNLVLEGTRRFQVKADLIRNSGARFVEAGTRWRYNYDWHSFLMGLFLGDLSNLVVGTTNLSFALTFGLTPIVNDDVKSIESPSLIEIEKLLPGPIVVKRVTAFEMAHLNSHFGDELIFEWDSDLASDIGPLGNILSLDYHIEGIS